MKQGGLANLWKEGVWSSGVFQQQYSKNKDNCHSPAKVKELPELIDKNCRNKKRIKSVITFLYFIFRIEDRLVFYPFKNFYTLTIF